MTDDIDEIDECEHDDIDDDGDCVACKEFIGWECERCSNTGLDKTELNENDYFGRICDDCYHTVGHRGRGHYNDGEHWL